MWSRWGTGSPRRFTATSPGKCLHNRSSLCQEAAITTRGFPRQVALYDNRGHTEKSSPRMMTNGEEGEKGSYCGSRCGRRPRLCFEQPPLKFSVISVKSYCILFSAVDFVCCCRLVLSCPVFSCPVLSCLTQSCILLTCFAVPCLFLSCLGLLLLSLVVGTSNSPTPLPLPSPPPTPPPSPNRFCPYFTSAVVPAPVVPAPATAAKAGSLPLSPVTPMRPARRGSTSSNGNGGGGGGGGGSVPASPLHQHAHGKHASPGAAATARAISDELGGGRGTSTPSRPAREGKGGGGGGGGGGEKGRSGGGGGDDNGMLSFVCFSMGGEGKNSGWNEGQRRGRESGEGGKGRSHSLLALVIRLFITHPFSRRTPVPTPDKNTSNV